MLADLSDEGAAIGVRHPVIGLDALLGINARLEALGLMRLVAGRCVSLVEGLGIHACALLVESAQNTSQKFPKPENSVTYYSAIQ